MQQNPTESQNHSSIPCPETLPFLSPIVNHNT